MSTKIQVRDVSTGTWLLGEDCPLDSSWEWVCAHENVESEEATSNYLVWTNGGYDIDDRAEYVDVCQDCGEQIEVDDED